MPATQQERSGQNGDRGWLPTFGLLLLPILCCGLPVLIATGGLGVIGSVLRNPYVVGVALLLLVGLVAWAIHRRVAGRARDCAPKASDREAGKET